jgi:uncharacterized protein YndB with AHSA1/START domain
MRSNGSAADNLQVDLRSEDGAGLIRIEAGVDADIEEVWSALTEPSRLIAWYGEIAGDLRIGGSFSARLFASGWEGTGRVEAREAPRRLVTTSKDPEEPHEDLTEVTLSRHDDETILRVEQRGIPLSLLWAYGAGLQIHVEDLAEHIAGRQRSESGPRFDALIPRYQALAADIS